MVDATQFFAMLARAAQIGSGMVVAVLSAAFLTAEEQGYVFTFLSLVAVQVFAELGLTTVLLQFSARESRDVSWNDGNLVGASEPIGRIASLVRLAVLWFGGGAIGLAVVLSYGGLLFLQGGSDPIPADVERSWVLLAVVAPMNLVFQAFFAILEGLGRVIDVAVVRLAQVFVGGLLATYAAVSGSGMMVPGALNLGMALVGLGFLFRIRKLLTLYGKASGLRWRGEVLPFQWRIAVSWMSGYVVFQLMTPLVFRVSGAEAAGRLGMSHQLLTAASSVCAVLVSSKTSSLARQLNTDTAGFEQTFRGLAARSIALLFFATMFLLAIDILLTKTGIGGTYLRLLPPLSVAILSIACMAAHVVTLMALYLRLYLVERLMWVSVANAVAMSLLLGALVPRFGVAGAVYAYLVTNMAISLPLSALTFTRFRAGRNAVTA